MQDERQEDEDIVYAGHRTSRRAGEAHGADSMTPGRHVTLSLIVVVLLLLIVALGALIVLIAVPGLR